MVLSVPKVQDFHNYKGAQYMSVTEVQKAVLAPILIRKPGGYIGIGSEFDGNILGRLRQQIGPLRVVADPLRTFGQKSRTAIEAEVDRRQFDKVETSPQEPLNKPPLRYALIADNERREKLKQIVNAYDITVGRSNMQVTSCVISMDHPIQWVAQKIVFALLDGVVGEYECFSDGPQGEEPTGLQISGEVNKQLLALMVERNSKFVETIGHISELENLSVQEIEQKLIDERGFALPKGNERYKPNLKRFSFPRIYILNEGALPAMHQIIHLNQRPHEDRLCLIAVETSAGGVTQSVSKDTLDVEGPERVVSTNSAKTWRYR